VAAEWKAAPVWSLQGSYGYLEISLHNQPGNTDTNGVTNAERSSPRHQVALQSRFNIARRLECDQIFRYVSALPARKVDGYATLDLRLGVPLPRGLRLSVVGQNLLQPRHAEFGHDPPPTVEVRRAGYVQLTWAR
jgi:iron complex outermembrane receptor protein